VIIEAVQLHEGVESRVHRIFRDGLELDVEVDTDVIAGGLLDSLAFVQLLVSLEEEFGLEVNLAEMEIEDFSSVSRIARLVTSGRDAAG
jgi:D-alanine--poly(phosphoribitol) ligase subunit 2